MTIKIKTILDTFPKLNKNLIDEFSSKKFANMPADLHIGI